MPRSSLPALSLAHLAVDLKSQTPGRRRQQAQFGVGLCFDAVSRGRALEQANLFVVQTIVLDTVQPAVRSSSVDAYRGTKDLLRKSTTGCNNSS
jgi:hypothetical protein